MSTAERHRTGARLVLAALTAAVLWATTTSSVGARSGRNVAEYPAEHIAIRQETATIQGPCRNPALSITSSVRSDPSVFVLRIVVAAPLCSPIEAVAAIYRMPGNGIAWPQQLAERAGFTLAAAGVTEVVFTKTSEPVQFDVLTGETPDTISPTGPWHGPLLFPLNLGTSQQWWGTSAPDPVVSEAPMVPVLAAAGVLSAVAVMSTRRRGRHSPAA